MAHDVFISHSSKDKLTADAVCAVLESKSIRCWVAPRDILPGADWGESIIKAIKESRVMVLIFSKNANDSVQIKREVERAVHHGSPVIPLRIEDILPTGALEYSISTAHWLDAFNPPMERHLDYLAKTVEAILQGKPAPVAPPPGPAPRPWWVNPAIAGGIIAVLLILCLLLKLLFPPSLKGTWDLASCSLATLQTTAISDLMTAALTGHNITGKLQVKSLNEYSATMTATDTGTVALAAPQQAQGLTSTALTFTSDSTHKPSTVTYQTNLENNGQWAAFGVPANEKIVLFGVNAGAAEVIVHGTPSGNPEQDKVPADLVGTWSGTPFNMNPPNNLWTGSLTITADGHYTLSVTHSESGLLDAKDGNWSAKPGEGNAPSPMPMYGMGSGLFTTGHYTFAGSGGLEIATTDGTYTYKRGW